MGVNATEVKKLLRENGIDTKNIRVRIRKLGYGSHSVDVTVKDLSMDLTEINRIVSKKYQRIRYDEHVQGEILEGGNKFVSVSYDFDIKYEAINEELPQAEEIIKELESSSESNSKKIFENEEVEAIYFFQDRITYLYDKNKDQEKRRIFRSHSTHNAYDVAEVLVTLKNGRLFTEI